MSTRGYPSSREYVGPHSLPKLPTGPAAGCPTAVQGILLTDDEHRALDLTAELWNLLNRVVGDGRSRAGDLSEAATHIHNLQHAVLAQAAARAYPDRYRLLGGTITQEPV